MFYSSKCVFWDIIHEELQLTALQLTYNIPQHFSKYSYCNQQKAILQETIKKVFTLLVCYTIGSYPPKSHDSLSVLSSRDQ
jgi:hypothetical protein